MQNPRKAAKEAKNVINILLKDDTENAGDYRKLASQLPRVVDRLTDKVKDLERENERLRDDVEKINETISKRNETIKLLQIKLDDKGGD